MKSNEINFNVSPIPFYDSISEQIYRRIPSIRSTWRLYVPNDDFGTFFIEFKKWVHLDHIGGDFNDSFNDDFFINARGIAYSVTFYLYDVNDKYVCEIKENLRPNMHCNMDEDAQELFVFYNGGEKINWNCTGYYYIVCECVLGTRYSEMFHLTDQRDELVELRFWNNEPFSIADRDFVQPERTPFVFSILLDAALGAPDYVFEEDVISRDGYLYPTRQVSKKVYKMVCVMPEIMCDVIRLVRLADVARLTYRGKTTKIYQFLPTFEWQSSAYLAKVTIEFTTDTIIKKIPTPYIEGRSVYLDEPKKKSLSFLKDPNTVKKKEIRPKPKVK